MSAQPEFAEGVAATTMRGLPKRDLALALGGAVLRLLVWTAVIVLMLWLVPDSPDASLAFPVAVALVGTGIYAWFFAHQLRGVYSARFPMLRAIEAFVLVGAMFLAIFAMVYVMISSSDSKAFTEVLDPFTGYYFSLTVLATVGFGDITPVSTVARAVTMMQMAIDIAFIAALIRVMGSAAKRTLEDRRARPSTRSTP